MSQPDLLVALRRATPAAPASLRARVEATAASAPQAPAPHRRLRPRLLLAAAATLAVALLAGALVLLPGGGAPTAKEGSAAPALPAAGNARALAPGHAIVGALAPLAPSAGAPPAPSPERAQRYAASLQLRLADGQAVAQGARRASRIAQALGGYVQTVHVSVSGERGSATVVLRVPRQRVGEAVDRLSALGTVLAEHVSIDDLQAGVDTLGVRIVRLERALAAALNGAQNAQAQRLAAALHAQIVGLQRARADTLRAARDATVSLVLATAAAAPRHPPRRGVGHHGPFHELGRLFRLTGIGAVYALALGAPLALLALLCWFAASRVRRRREEQLLSRS